MTLSDADVAARMQAAAEHILRPYLAAIRRPEDLYFTLEGIAKHIRADRVMQHRDLGLHDPIGPALDLRIGYTHFRDISLVLPDGSIEELHYEGTPPDGLRSGDKITVRGWEGKLVQAPRVLQFGNIKEEYPHFAYVLDTKRPREVHQIIVPTAQGTMTYGPDVFNFPRAPYDSFSDRAFSIEEFRP